MGCRNCGKKRAKAKIASFNIRIPMKVALDSQRTREIQGKLEIYAKELIDNV